MPAAWSRTRLRTRRNGALLTAPRTPPAPRSVTLRYCGEFAQPSKAGANLSGPAPMPAAGEKSFPIFTENACAGAILACIRGRRTPCALASAGSLLVVVATDRRQPRAARVDICRRVSSRITGCAGNLTAATGVIFQRRLLGRCPTSTGIGAPFHRNTQLGSEVSY